MEYKIIEVAEDELLNQLHKGLPEGWVFAALIEKKESNYTGPALKVLMQRENK